MKKTILILLLIFLFLNGCCSISIRVIPDKTNKMGVAYQCNPYNSTHQKCGSDYVPNEYFNFTDEEVRK